MRWWSSIALVLVPAALVAGCRPGRATGGGADAGAVPAPSSPARPEPGGGAAPDPGMLASSTDVVTVPRKNVPVPPRLAWTGSSFAVVWSEIPRKDAETTMEWAGGELRDVISAVDEFYDFTNLTGIERFETYLALVDGRTAAASAPVRLDGAGSGPRRLEGPVMSLPAWHDGALALAWVLWNEEAAGPPPARYVLGRWRADGTALEPPRILAKDRLHHAFLEVAPVHVASAGGSLYVLWPSESPQSGCRFEHGDADSVACAWIDPKGASGTLHECADVMFNLGVERFGEGFLVAIHNEHIGYHTWIRCHPAQEGCVMDLWESTNPFDRMIVAGGGAAVFYDELDEKTFEVRGHCVDVFLPEGAGPGGPAATCARPGGQRLVWNDAGLHVEIRAKDGGTHLLPYMPGDHVSPKLLQAALARKVPFADAVWSGHSIGLAWSKGRKIRVQVLGMDGLEGAGPG